MCKCYFTNLIFPFLFLKESCLLCVSNDACILLHYKSLNFSAIIVNCGVTYFCIATNKIEMGLYLTSEPMSYSITIDGKTDKCTLSKDINFLFTGFGVVGKVRLVTICDLIILVVSVRVDGNDCNKNSCPQFVWYCIVLNDDPNIQFNNQHFHNLNN